MAARLVFVAPFGRLTIGAFVAFLASDAATNSSVLGEASQGHVPLIVSGHLHKNSAVRKNGTLVLTVGSTGATGLGSFTAPGTWPPPTANTPGSLAGSSIGPGVLPAAATIEIPCPWACETASALASKGRST